MNSQISKSYTTDNQTNSIINLSSQLSFVYGLDNQSIDYYSPINNHYSLFYNEESGIFYTKNDSFNLIKSSLNLFKIKEIKHSKRTLKILNVDIDEIHYEGINTSQLTKIQKVTPTCYNFGLVKTSKNTSILQIIIDTVSYKIDYKLIPLYDNKYKYFQKKRKSDTLISKSLFEGSIRDIILFKNNFLFNTIFNPIILNDKVNIEPTIFIASNTNNLRLFMPKAKENIHYLNENRLILFDTKENKIYSYDSLYNSTFLSDFSLNKNSRNYSVMMYDIISDIETRKSYIHVKLKSDSIIDELYSLEFPHKKILSINSSQLNNIAFIKNNEVYLNVVHPIDRHKYIYKLNKKISLEKETIVRVRFFKTINVRNLKISEQICGNGSLYEDKLVKQNINNLGSIYSVLDTKYAKILKTQKDTNLYVEQQSIEDLILTLNSFVDAKCELLALTKLFVFKDNSTDSTMYNMIEYKEFEELKIGIKKISEIAKKITNIPENKDKRDTQVTLYSNDGYVLYFIKVNKKWFLTSEYSKIIEQ